MRLSGYVAMTLMTLISSGMPVESRSNHSCNSASDSAYHTDMSADIHSLALWQRRVLERAAETDRSCVQRVWTCSCSATRRGCPGWTDCHHAVNGRRRSTRESAGHRGCRCWPGGRTRGPSRSLTLEWRPSRSRWSPGCECCVGLPRARYWTTELQTLLHAHIHTYIHCAVYDFMSHFSLVLEQEAQLMLTTGSTRLAVSRGQ